MDHYPLNKKFLSLFLALIILMLGFSIGRISKKTNTQQTIIQEISPIPTDTTVLPPQNVPTQESMTIEQRKTCTSDNDCYLTELNDCMSDRYSCGVADYASDSVQAFNRSRCVEKDPNQGVPGCMVQSKNEGVYSARCSNNVCQKVKARRGEFECANSSDCPGGAPCQNGSCIGVDLVQ